MIDGAQMTADLRAPDGVEMAGAHQVRDDVRKVDVRDHQFRDIPTAQDGHQVRGEASRTEDHPARKRARIDDRDHLRVLLIEGRGQTKRKLNLGRRQTKRMRKQLKRREIAMMLRQPRQKRKTAKNPLKSQRVKR